MERRQQFSHTKSNCWTLQVAVQDYQVHCKGNNRDDEADDKYTQLSI